MTRKLLAWVCVASLGTWSGAGAAEDESTCNVGDSPEVLANVRWTSGVLQAEVPADLTYRVRVQARLGALRTEWTQRVVGPDARGKLTVELEPPKSAFLHALAEDYVTTLDVRISGFGPSGQEKLVLAAPVVFLAWPGGPGTAPVVWDLATMRSEAPAGVIDDEVRASLGDLSGIDRVMPPLVFTTPPPLDDDVAEGF